ncbi:hypothetical protein QI155_03330 [Thermodesulfovibrio sp. 1176]|uniref:hypothetical protein n=1 Tax=Thermodesulfovibrio sp. 1176 TaxID=3043424 RepID=UPI00248213A5|nr:hypothetical protein [Thermodesulfovibrio sp. 1176]MDI1471556.1 hypothetical protein [Thermodesulfovibrio sp. 1176]
MKQFLKALKGVLKETKDEFFSDDNIVILLIKKAIQNHPALTHLLSFLFGASFISVVFYDHIITVSFFCFVAQIILLLKIYRTAKQDLIKEETYIKEKSNE